MNKRHGAFGRSPFFQQPLPRSGALSLTERRALLAELKMTGLFVDLGLAMAAQETHPGHGPNTTKEMET